MKKEEGITLIALIVTIIIIIILSGIGIGALTGENRNNQQCNSSQRNGGYFSRQRETRTFLFRGEYGT